MNCVSLLLVPTCVFAVASLSAAQEVPAAPPTAASAKTAEARFEDRDIAVDRRRLLELAFEATIRMPVPHERDRAELQEGVALAAIDQGQLALA